MRSSTEMLEHYADIMGFAASPDHPSMDDFEIIAKIMNPDEKALFTAGGMLNYISTFNNHGFCVCAVTNQRILLGQKTKNRNFFYAIPLDELVGVSRRTAFFYNRVIFDTVSERFNLGVLTRDIMNIIIQGIDDIMHLQQLSNPAAYNKYTPSATFKADKSRKLSVSLVQMDCDETIVAELMNRKIKTAEDMVFFCEAHNIPFYDETHFSVIEEILDADEFVLFCFGGFEYHHIENDTRQGNCVCAITSERLIVARKNILSNFSVALQHGQIFDVTASTGVVWGSLTFHTRFESFTISCDNENIYRIKAEIHKLLMINSPSPEQKITTPQEPTRNPLDDIRQLKELLDMGALTQEEFDAKKKKLLNL